MYRLSNICGSCHVVVGQPSHSYGTTVTQLCVSCHTMQIAICCVRRATVAGYFFSPRPQRLDDRTHPLITLANPLRSLCALCGFAREEQLPRDIFSRQAAKVAKEKHGYFCTTFHDLCFFSNDFPLLMLAIARTARGFMWLGQNRQPNRLNWGDALAKSRNEQSQTCLDSAMARKGGR